MMKSESEDTYVTPTFPQLARTPRSGPPDAELTAADAAPCPLFPAPGEIDAEIRGQTKIKILAKIYK